MKERIERLKVNTVAWAFLSIEDRAFFESMGTEDVVWFNCDGGWTVRTCGSFGVHRVYRIHEDYNPEYKPIFPGYVLCEFKDDRFMRPGDGEPELLAYAVDLGCVGYVFKEWLNQRFTSPIMFIDLTGSPRTWAINENVKPATLGWVVFKEEKE